MHSMDLLAWQFIGLASLSFGSGVVCPGAASSFQKSNQAAISQFFETWAFRIENFPGHCLFPGNMIFSIISVPVGRLQAPPYLKRMVCVFWKRHPHIH